MKLRLGLSWVAIAAAVLAACASTPSRPVPAGSRVVVRLYDSSDGVELALANESYPELSGLYSQRRADATLKLAPDELMGELLASLGQAGLDAYGVPGEPPPDATGWLTLDRDGTLATFVEPSPRSSPEERAAYARMKYLMDHYYRHVGAKQFVDNPKGAEIFRDGR